jgi:Fe-S cluster biosynthesis and repair protein YggX
MTYKVNCLKLNKEAEGLSHQPYPGDLGKKIQENISAEAWQMWLGHQTMLINEYRLSMLDLSAREFLAKEMDKFLFGQGSEAPSGYVPPEK